MFKARASFFQRLFNDFNATFCLGGGIANANRFTVLPDRSGTSDGNYSTHAHHPGETDNGFIRAAA
jgi:hypothetical protein